MTYNLFPRDCRFLMILPRTWYDNVVRKSQCRPSEAQSFGIVRAPGPADASGYPQSLPLTGLFITLLKNHLQELQLSKNYTQRRKTFFEESCS